MCEDGMNTSFFINYLPLLFLLLCCLSINCLNYRLDYVVLVVLVVLWPLDSYILLWATQRGNLVIYMHAKTACHIVICTGDRSIVL